MHNLLSLVLSKILFYDHFRSAMLIVLNVDVTMTSYSCPLFKNPHTVFGLKRLKRQNLNPYCLLFALATAS